MTTEQVRLKTKDVTRRMGWENLVPGTYLQAVVKGQGIRPGEKIERICTIRVTAVRRERLDAMLAKSGYGRAECRREGFPAMRPIEFVEFFCRGHKGCTPGSMVTRIEFEYPA